MLEIAGSVHVDRIGSVEKATSVRYWKCSLVLLVSLWSGQ